MDNYQLPLNPSDFALQKAIQYQGYALAKERHLLLKQLLNRMAFQVEGRKVVRITQHFFSSEVCFSALIVLYVIDSHIF